MSDKFNDQCLQPKEATHPEDRAAYRSSDDSVMTCDTNLTQLLSLDVPKLLKYLGRVVEPGRIELPTS